MPLSVPSISSRTSVKENVVKLGKPPYFATYNIHPSTQLEYIQHLNATGKLISIPQSTVPHVVTQRHANMQGNMITTHQLQGSRDVTVVGKIILSFHSTTLFTISSLNYAIERETKTQGSLARST